MAKVQHNRTTAASIYFKLFFLVLLNVSVKKIFTETVPNTTFKW